MNFPLEVRPLLWPLWRHVMFADTCFGTCIVLRYFPVGPNPKVCITIISGHFRIGNALCAHRI